MGCGVGDEGWIEEHGSSIFSFSMVERGDRNNEDRVKGKVEEANVVLLLVELTCEA